MCLENNGCAHPCPTDLHDLHEMHPAMVLPFCDPPSGEGGMVVGRNKAAERGMAFSGPLQVAYRLKGVDTKYVPVYHIVFDLHYLQKAIPDRRKTPVRSLILNAFMKQ